MKGDIPNYVRRGDVLKAADINRLIDAVRRATPIAGDGIMVSQTLAGSKIDVVRGIAAGAAGGGGEAGNAPFTLAVEHGANGSDYCIFLYAEKAFAVNGTTAACWNNASATDTGWRRVADDYTEGASAGVVSDATINELDEGESADIYAVAFAIGDGFSYLVLPTTIYATGGTAPTVADIPDDLQSCVASQVFVGTVSRTGTDETTGDAIYAVSNQAVRSAVSLSETDMTVKPWTVKATAKQGGGYALTVYLPSGCCQLDSRGGLAGVVLSPTNTAVTGSDGWYTIGDITTNGWVYAHCSDSSFTVDTTQTNTNNPPAFKVARVIVSGGTATVSQVVNYNIVVKPTQSASGGGTTVTVSTSDNPLSASAAGIGVVGSDGVIPLVRHNKISADIVYAASGALCIVPYIFGGAEGPSGEYVVNTENFKDKCLGESGAIKGEDDTAARYDHFHVIGDIRTEDGATGFFAVQENLISVFSNVGLWDETIGQPTVEDDYGSIITADDANWDDASVIKADDVTGDCGGKLDGSQMLALADHVHPICTEMAPSGVTGPTAPTPEMGEDDSKATGAALPAKLDTTHWEPGSVGYIESYCSRVVVQNTYRWFYFRQRKVSRTGQVIWVGPEYKAFRARWN